MKPLASLAVALLAALSLVACGGSESSPSGNTETFKYPSESMEPTIAFEEEVTVDLDAYKSAAPAAGDIVAFHPPRGSDEGGECGVHRAATQPCPRGTSGLSSETFIKRVVAAPGDRLSVRDGLPVVNGKQMFAGMIQKCSSPELCDLPKAITVPPNEYFVMGDNSGASFDSRFWGPVPRAAILGELER
jgi:signal peptidase I